MLSKSKQLILTVPSGIRFEALILVLQSATANAPAAAVAAERAAHRNGLEGQVKAAECRAAVEFIRIVAANELARIAGGGAAVVGGALFERGQQ